MAEVAAEQGATVLRTLRDEDFKPKAFRVQSTATWVGLRLDLHRDGGGGAKMR
jgi:hypothetical protein